MWKEYSKGYIKNNRAASVSVLAAAFIATFFLSLLCSVAYNFWVYDIERITLDEGDWQGRITGRIDENDLSIVQNFANVDKAFVNQDLCGKDGTVIDVYFQNKRTIFKDMPMILEQLGLEDDAATYHELLLSRHFIHNPEDDTPPLLLTFYLGVLLITSFSLILIIRNSFELSMNARIHQFGIFSSIGATPKQIRACLMQEAAVLSAIPILLGSLLGIVVSFGLMNVINKFAADVSGRHAIVFQYHPYVYAITIAAAVLTVLFSAWMPAGKLSKMTPLEAIRNAGSLQLKKGKHSHFLSLLFGAEGELAGNALKAQKKSLRISTLSLLLSFLGFSIMLCFTTLSGLSTRYTYFERYQDAWDVMVTVKDTKIEDFGLTEELQGTSGVKDITVYQKAEAITFIENDWLSDELAALGGFNAVAGTSGEEGQFQVKVPIIIMDDQSFLKYCSQIGVKPSLEGAVVLNRIWDSLNSVFRYSEYLPFLQENREITTLHRVGQDGKAAELPILSYTQEVPVLREEYDDYTLVHFIPLSAWENLSGQLGQTEADSYIRIFSSGDAALEDLNQVEESVVGLIAPEYEIESENRIQERLSNDKMTDGMIMIFGAFCVLLAVIGIANVFSNTLGFLRQRKREFAQYMSIGLTPSDMRKMFAIEAFVIAGKPIMITLPLTVAFVEFATKASHLDSTVFWAEAPIVPILVFGAAIAFFVALAYYIGGKSLMKTDLNETLRNDTLV